MEEAWNFIKTDVISQVILVIWAISMVIAGILQIRFYHKHKDKI